MADDVSRLLVRWTAAGVIDDETADRIRNFERSRRGSTPLRWPILVALVFGALMLASGVLLFVSAHWDTMSPQFRFGLVVLLVALFHVIGALVAERFAGMSTTLHAIGTVALGAGIFLAGQIFNLEEHWPGGVMLWALGAAIGWAVLGQVPQLAMAAALVPAWLAGEWYVATYEIAALTSARVLGAGVALLALVYFTALTPERADLRRQVLLWLGGISLVPAMLFLAVVSPDRRWDATVSRPSAALQIVGWVVAIGAPLLVAAALRRGSAWPNAVAALWVALLFRLSMLGERWLYAWWALGAMALVAWGVSDARRERINMGAALFAVTVLTFYFSEVMDRLERSASLVGLGVLFLAGGWALERIRRRLVLGVGGQG